ncbi:MAG: amino acid permease [Clostridia bacterium]|nr:amino acid permease [Clostridia bacterium]
MENNATLEKRYGLFTAICMVSGIVIGSGVFFKAQDILNYTEGNMPLGILAWIIGGAVMIICAVTFANFAAMYEKINGIVDYAEATVGKKYAYLTGWYLSVMLYPSLTSVLAYISAKYTLALLGNYDATGGMCMTLAGLLMTLSYAFNTLSPKLAGKIQVSTTIIKLIPLILMALIGTVYGIKSGNLNSAFETAVTHSHIGFKSLFSGVAAAAFAYEGWIIATSINAELKNAKKNLPIALTVGTLIIITVYISYYIGLSGAAPIEVLQNEGAIAAFKNIFGSVAGNILNAFIVVSCLGTLNGVMLASTRGFYSIALRGQGPSPRIFSQVDSITKMPTNSSIMGLVVCWLWLFYYYSANLTNPIFGLFSFDSSELPVITVYSFYIPIFVMFAIKKGKKNIIMPLSAAAASVFMLFCAIYAHGIAPYKAAAERGEFSCPILFYLLVFIAIMLIGLIFYKEKCSESRA